MNTAANATIADVTSVVTKGTTPTTLGRQFTSHGVGFIKAECITSDGALIKEKQVYIDEETDQLLKRSRLQKDDVLFSIAGVIGRAALVQQSALPANTNQALAILRPDTRRITPSFLYYTVRSKEFQDHSLGHVVQTAQANVSLGVLSAAPIWVPPLPVQQRIAGILSAYDDLIENSQRRIKILEAMARALYREWFVHFRFPGHENHPRVASPLGEIPQGWEVKKLGNLADISWGDTSTTKASYVEDGYAAYSASGSDGKLDHYDFDRTGIVLSAIGAQCGKTWLARGKWSCIKNTIRFWSKNDCVSTEFLFIVTEGQGFWPRRGAAQPFISQGDAERIDVLTPDRATMERFTTFVAASLERIATLEMQIQNLRRTRDLLLPRLLSGQIDMEKFEDA
jgi:type I restriction enzyme S subunit